jgi:rubrerythrin
VLTDHPCEGRDHKTRHKATKKADVKGTLLVDGSWYCPECAPRTAHRNCSHTSATPGRPCPYCGAVT